MPTGFELRADTSIMEKDYCWGTFMSHINSFETTTRSERETRRLGFLLGTLAVPTEVIALTGDLGAGKTRFAQGFGRGLGVPADEVINSPTFTLINQYQGRLTCYHIDLYRLTTEAEAETLGLDDIFYADGVCLVEWADRIPTELPADRVEIELHHLGETERKITVRAIGSQFIAQVKQLKTLWLKEKIMNNPIRKLDAVPINPVESAEKTSIQVLISPDEAPNFAMRRFIMEPGGGMPKHMNAVEHEQFVLRGKARVGIGDDVFEVEANTALFIPAGTPHWYQVLSDEPYEFLCLVPKKPDEVTILE